MPENANHSPRISFSHDFLHSDSIPIEQSPLQSPSESSSFDFSISGNIFSGESSLSAGEFFSDGKILPTEIKKRTEPVHEIEEVVDSSEPGRTKEELNPIRNVKPVSDFEMAMELKPRPLWFLNSKEPGGTKEMLNPIRNVRPVSEIEMEEEDESDEPSVLWFNNDDLEIGVDSGSQEPLSKKKKKKYRGDISVNSVFDVFPPVSSFGLGLIYFGSGGKTMMFDWLWISLFGDQY
ncbi:hypothetical protein AALP_AA6G350800 [Arabis alpina]|uniref:Uncharacterized protein n=1 Tax=Arabis alpina TaxID=50452 RepID=A0A087GTQ4_ARAAL|nr:hypothetical protein AALP_AA6G350800 [Arabis alpina]